MKLSVVVPVHNGGADLRACLQALARSSRKADEIIVVDDGSTDASAKCASELSARVISLAGEPRGPAFARNRGAAQATGDLLVFVDADVEVHDDTLARFERAFSDEPGLVAAFGSYDDQPPAPGRVSRFKNLLHHHVHQHGAREAETFWAGCGAIRREIFASLGGFSESYRRPSIEDIELGSRLRGAGHRIRLCPEILCTHRKRWTLASLLRTDISCRAIPWTRLILQQGRLPSGLNTDRKSRASAALAALLVFGCIASPVGAALGWRLSSVAAGALGLVAGLLLGWLNRGLYRFFFGHGGISFGAAAVALHVLYLLYSSAVFAGMVGFARVCGRGDGEGQKVEAAILPLERPSRLRKHLAGAIVFALLFAVYVGNGDALPGNDATPNVHLAATLLSRGTLVYTPESDPFFFRWTIADEGILQKGKFHSWDERVGGHTMRELMGQGKLRSPEAPYYFSRTTKPGEYVSSYGAITGLFALPFVAAVAPFVDNLPDQKGLLWFLSKLAASFAVAASAWFLFLVAAAHLRLPTAVILTLTYGLATCVWSMSSQTLWQHAPGEFFLALGMFCLFRRTHRLALLLAGFSFGLAFMCRPTNSLAMLAGFVVLLGNRRAALRYLAGGLPVAVAFFAYNLHYFHKWIVFGQVTSLAERLKVTDPSMLWQRSLSSGLAGVLVSPSRGLFVYSPIFVVSVWAAFRIWREQRWLPLRAAAIAAVGICLVTARWSGWWGGWCYGYRLVVDTAILLAFLAIPVAERIRARRGLVLVVGALALWSLGVQVLGVYVYDVTGWNARPGYAAFGADGKTVQASFTTSEEAAAFCLTRGCSYSPVTMNLDSRRFYARLWNVRDSQILYYLQNLKQSRLARKAFLRVFLGRDG